MVIKELAEKHNKTIVDVGTCGLHNCHNGYEKALGCLSFDFNAFAYDLWYFFKNSAARREDFKLTELVTEIETQIVLRHVPSRWLLLRKVLQRIIDQWDNLKEYFLKFLPTTKGFKTYVETTQRYQSIRKMLTSNTTVLYMSFAVYVGEMLESFLILFQSSKPLVHVLYPAIGDMFFKIMTNFIKKPMLMKSENSMKDAQQLSAVDVRDKHNLKSLHDIDFGHKTSYQIALIESGTNLDVVKTEMKMCYQTLTEYLTSKLPHRHSLIKELQYLHYKKRHDKNAVPSIRRVAEKMFTVLQRSKFFGFTEVARYNKRILVLNF